VRGHVTRCRKAKPTSSKSTGSKSSLQPVSPIPLQSTVSTSQLVTSQAAPRLTSLTSSSSAGSHLTSLSSSSSQPESLTSPVAKQLTTSDTTSQPADVTEDDDVDEFVLLRARLLPVDASVHLHPPRGSYQPCALPRQSTTSRHTSSKKLAVRLRSTTSATTRLTSITNKTTTTTSTSSKTTTTTSTSNNNGRLDSCQREGDSDTSVTLNLSVQTAALRQSPRHAAYRDVTPTTGDVTSSCCDVISEDDNEAVATDAISETRLLHVVRPTSPAATSTQTDDTECCLDVNQRSVHDDDGSYEKLRRPHQRQSAELSGYTSLRPQRTRDSVMSVASYESIPRSMLRRHAPAPTADDDNVSTLTVTDDDYLYPTYVNPAEMYTAL